MKTENQKTIPMNIQFFAASTEDSAPADNPQDNPAPADNPQDNPAPADNPKDIEAMLEKAMADLAAERAEKAKEKVEKERTKAELDKALKKVGELTKTVRQSKTAQELEDEAEKERQAQLDAEFKRLQEFEKKTLAKERYLMQGMAVEMAEKAAKAEVEGDMEALTTIQKQHTDAIIKAKEMEWKKSRPPVNAGIDGEFSVTKEQFEKMGYQKRVELKNKNPELYKKFTE